MARKALGCVVLGTLLASVAGCAQCQQLAQWKVDRLRDCCDRIGSCCRWGRDSVSGWTTPAPAPPAAAPPPALVPVPPSATTPVPYSQPLQPAPSPMPGCNPGVYPPACGTPQGSYYGGYYGNELVFPIN